MSKDPVAKSCVSVSVAVVVLFFAATSPFSPQGEAENLLVNPDFEQEGTKAPTPEFWYPYSGDDTVVRASKGETITDARVAHRGSRCGKVTSQPGIRVHHGRDVAVEQGKEYVLSFFARGKGKVWLGWYELKDGAFLKTVEETSGHELTEEWRQFLWRSAPQLKDTNRVRVFIGCQGEVYVDSARLCAAAALGPQQPSAGPELGPPILAPTYVTRAPRIDGQRSEGEWDNVTMVNGFLGLNGKLSSQQTKLWAAFDEGQLYLCFQSFSRGGVVGTARKRDDHGLFSDDAVEVFLRPEGQGSHYQFAVNPLGAQYDAEAMNSAWNATWQAACSVRKDVWLVSATWTVEVAVPFAAFGREAAPSDGALWTANFARDWTSTPEGGKADSIGRWTTWASVGGNFHTPERFGQILFSRKAPAVQLTELGDLPHGLIALQGRVAAPGPQQVTLAWALTPQGQSNRRIAGGEVTYAASPTSTPFRFDHTVEVAGTSLWPVDLTFAARAGDETFYRALIPYEVIPGFRVDVAKAYTRKFLEARFDVSRLPKVPGEAYGVIKLVGQDGKVVAQAQLLRLGTSRKGTVRLQFKDAAPGEYRLQTSLVDARGQALAAKTQAFVIPPPPVWLGNKLGISDKVPFPFENVRVTGTEVSVWGRTYKFADSLFPTQILNQGVSQLARPIELVLQEKGERRNWTSVSTKVVNSRATDATLSSSADSVVASLRGSVKIEYDGFAMFDFALTPKGPHTLEALCLEIPLPRQEAAYLRAIGPITKWAEERGYAALIGNVPNDTNFGPQDYAPGWMPNGWKGVDDFIYQLYIGNDYRGFFVIQDREENRFLIGGNVELAYEGNVTRVKVYLISKPTRVDKPLHYTLAIVATPFKRYRHEMERLAFAGGHNPQWVLDNGLKGWIPGSLVWKWGRIEKDYTYTPQSPSYLKDRAVEFREAGMQCLPNQSNSFCVTPYEPFDTYKDEWVYEPWMAYPNHEGSDVSLVMCSPQGSFADFYLWWVKSLIDEYGIGGLYFDLSGWAGNSNPLSGGGWTDAAGSRHMTSTVFALRELYKRIYTLLEEEGAKQGQEFFILQHSMAGPITAFTDQVTWGEGYAEAKDWNCVTPNLLRANSLRPLGAAETFYPTVSIPWYREGHYLAPHYQALARSLTNGTLTCGLFTEQVIQDLFPLWKWWKEFDVDTARWIPWFEKDPRLKATPSSLYVSFYHHPGKATIVVSNLTKEPVNGTIEMDLQGLGLPGGTLSAGEIHGMEFWDKERRYVGTKLPAPTRFEVRDGKVPVTIGAENYCVIRVPMN